MFEPREGGQREVLEYSGGWMAVSAVPGSGKTQTLSALAARLIADSRVGPGQEVLIVTFANSSVRNFEIRIRQMLQQAGLLAIGYRVRTLHGLGHDILRERPGLVGLADDFQIMDDRAAESLLLEAAQGWVRSHPEAAGAYLDPTLDSYKYHVAVAEKWPNLIRGIAQAFIKTAKDGQATPALIRRRLESVRAGDPLVEMGLEIYSDYQRALSYHGAVDFSDLIRLALEALRQDEEFLARLRRRWPYILEDEAQDSNHLQEEILRRLAGEGGNWVRVGDPNQAIYETFTTASPRYLRDFIARVEQKPELLYSGRSSLTILDLANELVRWTREEHPVEALRDALADTLIRPTPLGDPQPNPRDDPGRVVILAKKRTPDEEAKVVVESIQKWYESPAHSSETLAVLAFMNEHASRVSDLLADASIPFLEVLSSSQQTREAAGALGSVLHCLAEPTEPRRLAIAFSQWAGFQNLRQPDSIRNPKPAGQLLQRLAQLEGYLWSSGWNEIPEIAGLQAADPDAWEGLKSFREVARRWQSAIFLPVDQLVLTVAQDLFAAPVDLALAYKIAGVLRSERELHPGWSLKELAFEMDRVATKSSRLVGFSDEDTGFDPDLYRGKVVVSTIHRAKGLEWDRVYLTSVNSYDFPSGLPGDRYISEKKFVRGQTNLEAETIARLRALLGGDIQGWNLAAGEATLQARIDVAAERLRLLYVGITRAKKELIISWNMGSQAGITEAAPLADLRHFLEERQHAASG